MINKRLINITYLSLRKIHRLFSTSSALKNPAIIYLKNEKEVEEQILAKINWYVPLHKNLKIISSTSQITGKFDLLFIANKRNYLSPKVIANIGKSYAIDESFYSHFPISNLIAPFANIQTSEYLQKVKNISKRNFDKFCSSKTSDKIYLFGTGPSIKSYKDIQYDRSAWKIICNSIVKNKHFMDLVKPDAICFADPVFHFGYSEYAKVFRSDLLKRWGERNFYIFIPEISMPLFLHHFPKVESHLIGLGESSTNFLLNERLEVSPSENIFTYFMLPIATKLGSYAHLLGFDGKDTSKKQDYFWEHQDEFQYLDLIEGIKTTHVSFFRDANYGGYYEKHVEKIGQYINYYKSTGHEFHSLRPTYISYLQ